jgi:hypothetical protein
LRLRQKSTFCTHSHSGKALTLYEYVTKTEICRRRKKVGFGSTLLLIW